MNTLQKPYWVETDTLPGFDFNRALHEPGTNEKWPDGVVAVFVDDDFWCVAALPWKKYKDKPIEEIVAEFWPEYTNEATYAPDHGTIEAEVYHLKNQVQSLQKVRDHLDEKYKEAREENKRLTEGRTDTLPRNMTRYEAMTNYFVSQYEHLLVAFAHEAIPYEEEGCRGLCSKCDLLCTNRVHMKKYIDKHNEGYPFSLPFIGQYPDRHDSDECGSNP